MDGPIGCVHWDYNHCDNRHLGWSGASFSMVSRFILGDSSTSLCASEDSCSFMGGNDVVHRVRLPLIAQL